MFTYFYHQQLRRYLIAFASFFDNIQVQRFDANNTPIQRMVVPLEYGPKERWLARLVQDPDFTKGVSVVVPRMSFEMTNLGYDSARHQNALDNLNFNQQPPKQTRLYVGVPYTMSMSLDILVKLQGDGMQIVEQILPYFTPDLTFRLVPIPELGFQDQVPITLTSVSQTDNYEGDFEHRRAIIWTLTFTMKVNFYGPSRTAGRIQTVDIDIFNSPLADIIDGPATILETEDQQFFELETGSGHLLGEATPDTYLSTTPTVRIEATPYPTNQDPVPGNVTANTVITEDI
jgi:hypothetical protein